MKVLVIAPPWLPVPPTAYGGTELVIDGLCRGLAELGHDVHLFATGDSTCPVPTGSYHEVALGTGQSQTAANLAHVLASYDAAAELAPDIVHDHSILGAYVAASTGTRAVTTNHSEFDRDANATYARIAGRVPVFAISHAHARTARGFAPAAVIHHGIDLDRYPAGAGDGGYALFLGRIAPSKGVHLAIAAAREAGLPLRIAAKVTEAPEIAYLREVIEPLLGPDAEFLGEVGGADKARLIGGAACLVNPIQWDEPFGMVMIEAMACGTPVVAMSRGAVPELVADGVTGYAVDSTDKLAARIRDAQCLDRSVVREEVARHFSIAHMAAAHVRAYEAVLAS